MTQHQEPVLLALAFCVFWIVTLQRSLNSTPWFILRSLVVASYSFVTIGGEQQFDSIAEWVAQAMVWSHWFTVVTVLVYPDPRFQRRSNARR